MYDALLRRLLGAIGGDAAALLQLDGDALRPLAVRGLSAQLCARTFAVDEHPRLRAIYEATAPVRFAPEDPRPDPYDGLIEGAVDGRSRVHSCMGAPVRVQGQTIGLLTVDALVPGVFDAGGARILARYAMLAAAALRIGALVGGLEAELGRKREIVRALSRPSGERADLELIGTSLPMQHLAREIEVVAQSDVPVLIQGETGTGKEVVARCLHARSGRADEALIHVNCAALPEALAESELFGHVRGAYTGAVGPRAGKFELAHRGTLFLDEIGELPLTLQPKLLRALQQGELQRVGSDGITRVDVRIITATNRDLEREVEEGRFRADLFHRIAVYPITVPPLRARGDDLALLAGRFAQQLERRLSLGRVVLAEDALRALGEYAWPGNVRELQHVIVRATLRASRDAAPGETVALHAQHLGLLDGSDPIQRRAAGPSGTLAAGPPLPEAGFQQAVADFERQLIHQAVEACEGNWSEAARRLGLDRSNLHRMGRRLGLK